MGDENQHTGRWMQPRPSFSNQEFRGQKTQQQEFSESLRANYKAGPESSKPAYARRLEKWLLD